MCYSSVPSNGLRRVERRLPQPSHQTMYLPICTTTGKSNVHALGGTKKYTSEVRLNFSCGRLLKISELFSERVGAVDFFCHPVGEFSQFYSQPFNSVRVVFGNLFSERAFDLLRSGVFIDIQCFPP